MNFKDLREADLSKAQINKVHDKADDLPKSDFIKRYGKEGDAVRFATATNIVKKQLGLDEYVMNVDIATGKPFPKVPPAGTDGGNRNPYTSGRAAAKAGKKYSSNPHKVAAKKLFWSKGYVDYKKNPGSYKEELDKEDEKSIGDVIKGLKKAVKSHQGQVKSLTKDIQDEVEVTEARMPSDNDIKKKHGNATPMKTYKQGFDAASKGKKITTNPHKSMFGFDRSAWNKGFTDADQGFNIKTFSQNDYDDKGVMKKEEVVTEAVSAALVNQISRMTDRNNHFGVRIELARIAGDKELMRYYDSLEKMHMTSQIQNAIGNDAVNLRGKLEKVLKVRMKQRFGDKDSKRIMDAL